MPRAMLIPAWRKSITIDALAWNMAERLQQTPLLAGDTVDIAFTIGHNDHPEYGGLELSLRDLKMPSRETSAPVAAKHAPAVQQTNLNPRPESFP